jgi:hypothetical protein
VDRAFLDELEQHRSQLGIFLFAHAELVCERGELDTWGDQARQAIQDRLSIERNHEPYFLM